jgi:GT2 family glycosyltransferase
VLTEFVGEPDLAIEVIDMPTNMGYASAFNTGSRRLLELGLSGWVNLSHDVVLSEGALHALFHSLDVGLPLVGPTVRNLNTNEVFSSGGHVDVWSGRIWADTREIVVETGAQWLDGSCFAISKNLFESLQGMNEKLFLYFEDVDLGIRAGKLGAALTVLPVAVHQEPGGPTPYQRGHSSGVLARSNMDSPLFLSLVLRNVVGSLVAATKGHFADGISRLRGLFNGLWGSEAAY